MEGYGVDAFLTLNNLELHNWEENADDLPAAPDMVAPLPSNG
jgi:hypothetical protein